MNEQNFSETVKEEEIEHLRSVLKQKKMLSTYEKHTNIHTHQLFPRFKHLTQNLMSSLHVSSTPESSVTDKVYISKPLQGSTT